MISIQLGDLNRLVYTPDGQSGETFAKCGRNQEQELKGETLTSGAEVFQNRSLLARQVKVKSV